MVTKNPEALRLADEIDEVAKTYPDMAEVSAELRRLHAINSTLMGALGLIAYADPRGQLLNPHRAASIARIAITKAEGGMK